MAVHLQPAHDAASSRGATSRLAAFIANCRGALRPAAVDHAARRAFANWTGCALGAVHDDSVRKVRQVAMSLNSGGGQASIVGRAEMLDAVNAALVNGVAANALDYDDMHAPTLIHPTGPVVAAALALGETRGVSGPVLLSAMVAGIEIECRLGLALFPEHYDAGWHITSTLGTLGAAAAACVIIGLDAAHTQNALGIAATQAGGLRAMLTNPCKSFNIGRSASAGVMAALLAQAHLDSEPDVLEAKFGLFHVFGEPRNVEALTRDLGTQYVIADVSLKPYPCGIVIHPLIDACLELVRAHGRVLCARDIQRISAAVHPRAIELAGRQHPDSAIAGRYSLQHAAALALSRGSAGLGEFDGAAVDDPALAALRGIMDVAGDPSMHPGQARVALALFDGTRLEHAIDHPSGSPERPLTDAQLQQKFMALAKRAVDERSAEKLYELCIGLHRLENVNALRQQWTAVS